MRGEAFRIAAAGASDPQATHNPRKETAGGAYIPEGMCALSRKCKTLRRVDLALNPTIAAPGVGHPAC